MKMDIAQQTKHELRHDINEKIVFELQEIGLVIGNRRLEPLNDVNKL